MSTVGTTDAKKVVSNIPQISREDFIAYSAAKVESEKFHVMTIRTEYVTAKKLEELAKECNRSVNQVVNMMFDMIFGKQEENIVMAKSTKSAKKPVKKMISKKAKAGRKSKIAKRS